jgi:hypothetical protein
MTSFQSHKPHGRARTEDTQHLLAVRYADGRSAYIRVDPKVTEYGTGPVLAVAQARQTTGEIPDGEIVSGWVIPAPAPWAKT